MVLNIILFIFIGKKNKLSLVLNAEGYEYTKETTHTPGIKVTTLFGGKLYQCLCSETIAMNISSYLYEI